MSIGDPTGPSTSVSIFKVGKRVELVHRLADEVLGSAAASTTSSATGAPAAAPTSLATATFPNVHATRLFWSPFGQFLIGSNLGSQRAGLLEFYDCDLVELVTTADHPQMTSLSWDPSGRYALTSVCQSVDGRSGDWKASYDGGYRVYNSHGQLLVEEKIERLHQVIWRPRPPSVLSEKQLAELKNTMRTKHWKRFEQEDEDLRKAQTSGAEAARLQLLRKWQQYRQQRDRDYRNNRELRAKLRGGIYSDDEDSFETQMVTVEEEVSKTVEPLP